jgi:cysteine desulfurase family protein (TIGR01976 family)
MKRIILATMSLDLDAVRRQFPSLQSEWALFDNAGGSQILGRAVDLIADYLRSSNVQLGATYALSQLASERVIAGAHAAAALMNAQPGEVALGTSTTQLVANLALALPLAAGDEIIVTDCDHEANIGPWRRRCEHVKVWRLNRDSLALELDDLAPLLTKRTRLVCFTHASNLIGTVHDVAAITRFVHARGARVCVDGVAYAPHHRVDVRAWDVDYYVFSFYKVYGPHLAALYVKRQLFDELGNVNHYFLAEQVPGKLQPGHVPYELAAALPAVASYVAGLDYAKVEAHEAQLAARLLDWLAGRRGVRVLGRAKADGRVPTISFVVDGKRPDEIPPLVDRHRVAIRWGDFYARRLVDALGLAGGVVRASMVHYNTLDEVDRLIRALEEACP